MIFPIEMAIFQGTPRYPIFSDKPHEGSSKLGGWAIGGRTKMPCSGGQRKYLAIQWTNKKTINKGEQL